MAQLTMTISQLIQLEGPNILYVHFKIVNVFPLNLSEDLKILQYDMIWDSQDP